MGAAKNHSYRDKNISTQPEEVLPDTMLALEKVITVNTYWPLTRHKPLCHALFIDYYI